MNQMFDGEHMKFCFPIEEHTPCTIKVCTQAIAISLLFYTRCCNSLEIFCLVLVLQSSWRMAKYVSRWLNDNVKRLVMEGSLVRIRFVALIFDKVPLPIRLERVIRTQRQPFDASHWKQFRGKREASGRTVLRALRQQHTSAHVAL